MQAGYCQATRDHFLIQARMAGSTTAKRVAIQCARIHHRATQRWLRILAADDFGAPSVHPLPESPSGSAGGTRPGPVSILNV